METTTLGWQLSQLQQRISERFELTFNKLTENTPELPLLSGLDFFLVTFIAKVIFWVIVTGLLVWTTWKLLRSLKFYLKRRQPATKPLFRINNPSIQKNSLSSWVTQAQKFQHQGDYREAFYCLYQAMLQQLDNSGIIPQQSSRTDGEYWQIIQQLTYPEPYQQLLKIHEELCFGNVPPSLSLLETGWSAYQEIEKT